MSVKNEKTALVTGGAGFIGSHLIDRMLEAGYTVHAIDNLSTGSLDNIKHLMDHPKFTFDVGTILDEPLMESLISENNYVFHLAAAVGVKLIIEKPVDTIKTNILGSEIILKYANKYNNRVIITSTSEVYGKNDKTPFKEDDDSVYGPTTKSRWSYACSKAIDEFLSLAYHHEKKLPVIIVRLFNTVGPRQTGQYGMVLPTFVKQALLNHDMTVFGDGKQTRCFANVKDVVKSILKLVDSSKAEGQVFNIGSQERISIEKLAEKVRKMCNSKSKIVYIPYDDAFESGFEDMAQRMPDTTKLKKAIGFVPECSLSETINEIIEYYKQ